MANPKEKTPLALACLFADFDPAGGVPISCRLLVATLGRARKISTRTIRACENAQDLKKLAELPELVI